MPFPFSLWGKVVGRSVGRSRRRQGRREGGREGGQGSFWAPNMLLAMIRSNSFEFGGKGRAKIGQCALNGVKVRIGRTEHSSNMMSGRGHLFWAPSFFLCCGTTNSNGRTDGRRDGRRPKGGLPVGALRPSAPPLFLVGAPFVVAVDLRRPAREQSRRTTSGRGRRLRFLGSSNRVSSLSILRCLKSEEGPTNTKTETETEKRRRRRGLPSFLPPSSAKVCRPLPSFLPSHHISRPERSSR